MIEIRFNIPEEIAASLQAGQGQAGSDLSRRLLEMVGLEGLRSGQLTRPQLQRMLGFETRYELDGFLKEHGVFFDYSPEELAREAEASRLLFAERAKA